MVEGIAVDLLLEAGHRVELDAGACEVRLNLQGHVLAHRREHVAATADDLDTREARGGFGGVCVWGGGHARKTADLLERGGAQVDCQSNLCD